MSEVLTTLLRHGDPERDAHGIIVLRNAPTARNLDATAVLRIIKGAKDKSSSSTEMLEQARGWPQRSLLEPGRANVVRAIAIAPGARVLELGAQGGSITRYLGEVAGLVDALEASPSLARVAAARTDDLDTVRVFQGELEDVPEGPQYDLIVSIGQFELQGGGHDGSHVAFLESLRNRLAPGGTIVLAIDNKLGVKYLVGAPDPYTGRPFDSIEGYPHGADGRLFERAVLLQFFADAGLSTEVLGVFPDVQVARTVMAPSRLAAARSLLWELPIFPSPQREGSRLALASEGRLWRAIIDAGLADEFANAFLVLATDAGRPPHSSVWPEQRAAMFYSNLRRKEFAAQTEVEVEGGGVRFVRTFAAEPAPLVSQEMSTAPFVNGANFLEAFVAADKTSRASLLQDWKVLVHRSVSPTGVPVDAIPRNVLVTPQGLQLIDIEFRSLDTGVDAVIRRGILWMAAQLAETTSPSLWPYGRVREFAVALGALVGLDAQGRWITGTVRDEAALQARITTVFPLASAVEEWARELNALLDGDMKDQPLGLRTSDHFNAAIAAASVFDDYRERLEEERHVLEEEARKAVQAAAMIRIEADELAHRLESAAAAYEYERATASRELEITRSETHAMWLQLLDIQTSRGHRAVSFARRQVDKVAPQNSRRRRFFEFALRVLTRAVRRVRPHPVAALSAITSVPHSATPLVSIVIPIHGKWDYTSRCLQSLATHNREDHIEVIVVDDASPDDSRARLANVHGVKVIALDENVGFTRAANIGIRAATAEHVIMLNNDAEVTSGWLEPLLSAVEPDVGIVGAKLIYPDGKLQEAGGIIFSDGSGWNFGKYGDVNDPEYNYRRDVDYCSGAAILMTRRLLDAVGGFDERYAPAYYEDADMAFEARKHGMRVVYEPRSVVIHHEGISHGSDELVGVKRFQPINREKFLEKWADVLPQQREASHLSVVPGSARRKGKGTIIVVDHMVPLWNEDAGSLRMKNILLILVQMGHEVIVIPENRYPYEPFTSELQAHGILVWHGWTDYWKYIKDLGNEVSMVLISRASVASLFLRHFRDLLPDVPIVFDTVDLHFLREQRRFELGDAGGKAKGALATRELELALVRSADITLVVSPFEQRLLTELVPGSTVMVLPTVHDIVAPVAEERRTDVTFVGSFQHDPNADAVRWLIRDIFPLVLEEIPDARLAVVGKNPPPDMVALAPASVDFLGWVEDLKPIHARSRVSIAPLRYGAGVKGKVGDAWAHGVPVVMTPLAAEGMGVVEGTSALVANDARALADAVISLYRDEELWKHLADGGRERVEALFGTERTRELLTEIVATASLMARDGAASARPE